MRPQKHDTFSKEFREEAIRQARESKACLQKIVQAPLHNAARVRGLGLAQEADELCAIFSTIIRNMEQRLARQGRR